MEKLVLAAVGFVFIAACSPTAPPAEAPTRQELEVSGRVEPPPVHSLLGHRFALNLTSEQIGRLDSIGQWIHTENAPLQAEMQLRQSRAGGPVPRNAQALTVVQQLIENNRQAMRSVQDVLMPEQQAQVCTLFRGTETRPRRTPARRAQTRGQGVDPLAMDPNRPVWDWCAVEDAS
ncbi:hypothetical protein BH23GEM3_BH23GEM3_04310 [soil metagenome]|nr:Spy/CpxP family protein refolding chaperone [Gemmatimonadota bacterium]